MEPIDLNAARAAEAEARQEAPTVAIGDAVFELPPEAPLALLEAGRVVLGGGDGAEVLEAVSRLGRTLFGTRYDEFVEMGATVSDFKLVIQGAMAAYGLGVGESSASES